MLTFFICGVTIKPESIGRYILMYNRKLCLGIIEGFDMPYTEQVRMMKNAGFEAFFIDDCNRHAPVTELVSLAKELGMEISSYHAPFTKSYDMWKATSEGDVAKDELLDCLEVCAANEIPVMVTHAFIGYDGSLVSKETGIERYGAVADRAEALGITLALENTEGDEYLGILMDAFKDKESIGFCWDTGHELCYNYGRDMAGLYADRLVCTHLNDNLGVSNFSGVRTWHDDLHLLPFDGITDWESVAQRLVSANFQAPLSFELSIRSKPDRSDNDAYRLMKPELYFAAAYNRACRVAALIKKYENKEK